MPGGWSSSTYCLGLLTLAVGYALYSHGGSTPSDTAISLLLVGAAGILYGFRRSQAAPTRAVERLAVWAAFLFPVYVALQLVPLPLFLLRVVSPARAELTNALSGVMPAVRFAPLTIAPPKTWLFLPRIAMCVVILLVVRGIARDSPKRLWWLVAPLLAVGIVEAGWGLALYAIGDNDYAQGTFVNRDHFAGLLEMILPFAIVYTVSILQRGWESRDLTASSALKACAGLAAAAALFLGAMFSFSRMGFISLFGSLLLMGVLAIGTLVPGWKKWPAMAGMVLFVVLGFLVVTPSELIERFGQLGTDPSGDARLPLWKDTLRLFSDYRLFGCGLFNFFPGLLRYQRAGLKSAWFEAHNDFLQLLSELGIVGFLIPAALMAAVFACAARGAVSQRNRDARLLGLGCVGALAAILIHSAGDFNLYIPSNAMVLWWVSGLATGLPVGARRRGQERQPAVEAPPFARRYGLVLASAVTLYAVAALVFFHALRSNRAAERAFCEFGVCDPNTMYASPGDSIWVWGAVLYGGAEEAEPTNLRQLLRRDPAGAYCWSELGGAFQKEGKTDLARYCYRRSVDLSPNLAPTLRAAADFHFAIGERREAVELMGRLVQSAPDLASRVFAGLDERKVSVEEILAHGVRDLRSSHAFLRVLIGGGKVAPALQAWSWIVARSYADDKLAADVVGFLLQKKEYAAAVECWSGYLGSRRNGYPEQNQLFNGDFELDPTICALDWIIRPTKAAQITLEGPARSGSRSLRIDFNGTENVGFANVTQAAIVGPGRYRFSAYVRTKGITTDRGVGLHVFDRESQARLDLVTETMTGDNDWKRLEKSFDIRGGTRLIEVQVVRQTSERFDSKIAGTAWIDAVAIERERR